MGADPRLALARRILRWIERTGLAEFTGSECHQAHKNQITSDDLLPGLTLLVDRGYLRVKAAAEPQRTGRPKSPVYEVNPLS